MFQYIIIKKWNACERKSVPPETFSILMFKNRFYSVTRIIFFMNIGSTITNNQSAKLCKLCISIFIENMLPIFMEMALNL